MSNTAENNFNELIERYTVLELVNHNNSSYQVPLLKIPDELTAQEYWMLASCYINNCWVHHAHECLRRTELMEPDWKEYVDHLREIALPRVMPSVEAVELNLLVRSKYNCFLGRDGGKPNSHEVAYGLAKSCVEKFPDLS